MPALWSRWTQHKNFCFLFVCFETVLSYSTSENFANINFDKLNEIELYLIRSVKFETVQIHFLGRFSVCSLWKQPFLLASCRWGHFERGETSVFTGYSVWCHSEILLPWQHDVMTSPLYYLPNRDSFGAMLVHLLGVTSYTHKINNTKVGTWKHFIQSQNCGTLVCGDLNFYLQ